MMNTGRDFAHHLPDMTPRRLASLRSLARGNAAPGSMLRYLQDKARVELLAFEMGGRQMAPTPRGVIPPRLARRARTR